MKFDATLRRVAHVVLIIISALAAMAFLAVIVATVVALVLASTVATVGLILWGVGAAAVTAVRRRPPRNTAYLKENPS